MSQDWLHFVFEVPVFCLGGPVVGQPLWLWGYLKWGR